MVRGEGEGGDVWVSWREDLAELLAVLGFEGGAELFTGGVSWDWLEGVDWGGYYREDMVGVGVGYEYVVRTRRCWEWETRRTAK